MATKLEKMAQRLNDEFREKLDAAVAEKFGITVQTTYNFFANALTTAREDGADLTPEQFAWIGAYSDGFAAAMNMVRGER